jgi:very-short-patch-repair endonuclease
MHSGRPPLRFASQTTSPPSERGEEGRELTGLGSLPLPPEGGEVAPRSGDGVGDDALRTRSRRKPTTTPRARHLRQAGNLAEALLWLELKNSKVGGHKFTRQFAIEPYFADFCCRKRRLVFEIDGSQHADSQYDRQRDNFMRNAGYSVLRFWTHDVLKHRRAVCETILAALDGRLSESVVSSDLRFVFARHPEQFTHYLDPTP